MTTGRFLTLLFFLLVASWLQACLSCQMEIGPARPDFVLTTLVCICILVGTLHGSVLSVWAGFLTAVLSGYNYGSVLISRLVTGAVSGGLQQHIMQDAIVIPPSTMFVATWLSEGIYFLMAPNLHNIRWWLTMTLGEALYNSVLSVPIYLGLRLLKFGAEEDRSYNPFIETI